MDIEMIKLIIVNAPNYFGMLISIYLLWRIVDRLLPDDDDEDE